MQLNQTIEERLAAVESTLEIMRLKATYAECADGKYTEDHEKKPTPERDMVARQQHVSSTYPNSAARRCAGAMWRCSLAKELSMSPLRRRMIEDMQIRNLTPNTQRVYVAQVVRFACHFRKSPELLGPAEIRTYLIHLTQERRLAEPLLKGPRHLSGVREIIAPLGASFAGEG